MGKFFVAVVVVLAVILGFGIGVGLISGGVILQPEPKIVEVTNTVREKPEIHNEPTVFHEIEHTVKEPCVLPDTGGPRPGQKVP